MSSREQQIDLPFRLQLCLCTLDKFTTSTGNRLLCNYVTYTNLEAKLNCEVQAFVLHPKNDTLRSDYNYEIIGLKTNNIVMYLDVQKRILVYKSTKTLKTAAHQFIIFLQLFYSY